MAGRSLNQCQFIGNLGRDPEVRYAPSGDAVANFSLACNESWKDKGTGQQMESTEWVRCVAWGKLAEIINQYLRKGSQVYVSGRMKTRKYQDKEGNERSSTEIVVSDMLMLGGKQDGEHRPAPADAGDGAAPPDDGFDTDIPF